MSHHHEQLTAAIERGVREVLARGVQDPRVGGLITVTKVRVTPDLARAVVGVSVLPADKGTLTLHGLAAAAPYLRREVGKLLRTRQMPQLAFELDESIKREAGILKALDQARSQHNDAASAEGGWSRPRAQRDAGTAPDEGSVR